MEHIDTEITLASTFGMETKFDEEAQRVHQPKFLEELDVALRKTFVMRD